MKIIICGAGEVGFSLAKYLASENMQVTVIDERSDKLNKVSSAIDVRSIVGKTYNPNILLEAGADSADLLIAVSENDESNMLACEIAKILFNLVFILIFFDYTRIINIRRLNNVKYINNQTWFSWRFDTSQRRY